MGSLKLSNGAMDTEALNPPTQERYPCLKSFWKCDWESDGAGSLGGNLSAISDSITGMQMQAQF